MPTWLTLVCQALVGLVIGHLLLHIGRKDGLKQGEYLRKQIELERGNQTYRLQQHISSLFLLCQNQRRLLSALGITDEQLKQLEEGNEPRL